MIGVLPQEEQRPVVEEFFELFKTPWSWFEEGRAYDVVIAPASRHLAGISAKLAIFYGTDGEVPEGWRIAAQRENAVVEIDGVSVPILGPAVTFEPVGSAATGLSRGSTDRRSTVVRTTRGDGAVLRVGFDLFDEVRRLLSSGQSIEQAGSPTLELHIELLRKSILGAGVGLVEVPPVPAGHRYAVCLTHDIDFVGIRRHRFDHSMWGFVYRATVGMGRDLVKGRVAFRRALDAWRAVASLPFVYLGWARDFWEPFDWYLRVEQGLPATYFLIPFKGRPGDKVPGARASRRATAYDVTDLEDWPSTLERAGAELGVHGIDAWHSATKGREELDRLKSVAKDPVGIRMHWLMWQGSSAEELERAGFAYDSTAGYNETIGYRNGTTQVYKPLNATRLLELPMHIQDGALFYPTRLRLSEAEAWQRCAELFNQASRFGGVVTVLWHDRSHGPERFWGDFYMRLVTSIRGSGAWVGSARQVVDWFRARREISFEREPGQDGALRLRGARQKDDAPAFTVRVYAPASDGSATPSDRSWDGRSELMLDLPAPCPVS